MEASVRIVGDPYPEFCLYKSRSSGEYAQMFGDVMGFQYAIDDYV